jgi:biotin carboxyl carrier protein
MLYEVIIDGKTFRLELNRADSRWSCVLDGRDVEVDALLARPDVLSLRIGNRVYEVKSEPAANEWQLWVGSTRFTAEVRDPRSWRGRSRAEDEHGPKKVSAPMPGKILRLLVREGDDVALGAGIAVVEAMKMQNEIKSPKKGVVRKISVTAGSTVNPGDVLAVVE